MRRTMLSATAVAVLLGSVVLLHAQREERREELPSVVEPSFGPSRTDSRVERPATTDEVVERPEIERSEAPRSSSEKSPPLDPSSPPSAEAVASPPRFPAIPRFPVMDPEAAQAALPEEAKQVRAYADEAPISMSEFTAELKRNGQEWPWR